MIQKRVRPISIVASFRKTHRAVLREIARLERALTGLRFEGKYTAGRNLKEIQEVVRFLKSELVPHMEREDRSLFPFLGSHIPRLESLIHLLGSEHKVFKGSLARFEGVLRELSRAEANGANGKWLDLVWESGIYMVYLIRHHVHAEEVSVYDTVSSELHPEEKTELKRIASEKSVSSGV